MRSEAWRPAAAACNRLPREAREVARQALRPGCEELAVRIRRQLPAVVGRRAPEGDGSAAPRPKTATVERREASVPRHKRVHARLDALWDARRLARRLACRVISAFTRVHSPSKTGVNALNDARWHAPRVFRRAPERFSALRPPLDSG